MTDQTDDVMENIAPDEADLSGETPPDEFVEGDGGVSIDPRGALAFVLLVLLFYFGYYMISWFEIFVLRGA